MNILQVLPRRMTFGKTKPSSVELCVSEWISASRFRKTTTVVCEKGDNPLLDLEFYRLPKANFLTSWALAFEVRRIRKTRKVDVILKQQHAPTAARIACFNPEIPVILQTHNFIAPPKKGLLGSLSNILRSWEFRQISGMTFISEATKADFLRNWPKLRVPSVVVSNGFDFDLWAPRLEREKTVICVGRVMPEKGLLETAEALGEVLRNYPDWNAYFAVSCSEIYADYLDSIRNVLAPLGKRGIVEVDVPYSKVRAVTEEASIAIVASKWAEPFGRTALEAHAAGCALISSGTGGLREISGDNAVFLDAVSKEDISAALEFLIPNEKQQRELARSALARVHQLFPVKVISKKLDAFIQLIGAN